MNSKRNKKLCWNCEGEIDKDAIHCLFCGTELMDQEKIASKEPPEPPYRQKRPPKSKEEVKEKVQVLQEPIQEVQNESTFSFILLLMGAVFFAFSFFLLFFENKGILTLSWNASYWFVYLIISAPLFFFGWKILK
ncbi:MAG: zinc ribbon domain-containing protein [Chlamydiales bacterium]|nr:zinc ribbon domain-containing protein [Chlamydiales bacterium]